jgi:KDO2-lipid IV(A) lauroyltransferase
VILLAPHFVALDVGVLDDPACRLWSACIPARRIRCSTSCCCAGVRVSASETVCAPAGRPVIKAMRARAPFYYLPDQDLATKDGVFVPFFGVLAATLTTVPRWPGMTGAQVVPCISKLLPEEKVMRYASIRHREELPTGDVVADTRRMNRFIEQRVRDAEQYFWLHKRFKTRPEGERFY